MNGPTGKTQQELDAQFADFEKRLNQLRQSLKTDELLKWSENKQTHPAIKVLCNEVRKLRDIRDKQAAMIRQLQATIEELE